mgnify:CR=1 FL=1
MARHRGVYKPEHPEPYEVSRSQIQSFMNCPACFWMSRAKGIKFPGMPGFLLNTATDTLLKKDFDKYRGLKYGDDDPEDKEGEEDMKIKHYPI